MSRERYEAQAGEVFARVESSADPENTAQQMLEQLEHKAEAAEAWQASEEQFLARAVELMRRAAQARRAAARAEAERARIEGERQRERDRLRKNTRARERYRERRLTEPPRTNKRTGMHALAIEIDPAAYRVVKLAALQRCITIPTLIGDILRGRAPSSDDRPDVPGPRWRRTGDGRRANQHSRVDVDEDTWQAVHVEALQAGLTVSRRIGRILEDWAASRGTDESSAAR